MAKTDNYLRHTFLKKHQLNLIFKYDIDNVNHFMIKGHGMVKHVYDIKNAALPNTQNISQYKADGVRAFRIGQFNKELVRVVIETTVPTKGIFMIEGRKLTFILPSYKNILRPLPLPNLNPNKIVKKPLLYKDHKRYVYKANRQNKTIILDAGHGGRDIGASSKRVREKDLTLSMTLKLKSILKKMGYRVLLTRNKDAFMNLKQRTEYANNHRGSLFVSIHANAAPIKRNPKVRYQGIEVFYLSVKNSKRIKNKRAVYRGKKVYSKRAYKKMTSSWKFLKSRKLARSVKYNILKNVKKNYKIYDKGIKRKDFWVLLATKMPSILVETGYLTHKNEVKNLSNAHYQTLLVEGIANGINAYYSKKK